MNKIVEHKIVNIVLPISFNICFGFSKEPSHWDGSFEYPQHKFWLRNKKNNFLVRRFISKWGKFIGSFLNSWIELEIPGYKASGLSTTSCQLGIFQNYFSAKTCWGYSEDRQFFWETLTLCMTKYCGKMQERWSRSREVIQKSRLETVLLCNCLPLKAINNDNIGISVMFVYYLSSYLPLWKYKHSEWCFFFFFFFVFYYFLQLANLHCSISILLTANRAIG